MSSLKPFANENPCSISRRFFAFLIDAVIIIFLHGILFTVSASLISKTDLYTPIENELNSNMIECYKIQEEAHIYEYIGEGNDKYNNPISQEEMFKKWAYSHIKLSFENDNSFFVNNGLNNLENIKDYEIATYEIDSLAYFYVNFVPEKNSEYELINLKNIEPKNYYYNILSSKTYTYNDDSLWIYDYENYELPILKSEYAYQLYSYFFIDDSNQFGLSCYNLLAKSWQDIWKDEVNILINCNGYRNFYNVYLKDYSRLSIIIDLCSVFSYLLTFIIGYILPVCIFKKHYTIGRFAEKILVVDVDGYEVSTWQIILRSFLEFFKFSGLVILSNFLSAGGNSAIVYPLINISGFGISLLSINIIFLFILFVSFVISCFTSKKSNITDLITRTYIIDYKYFINHEKANLIISKIDEKNNDAIVVDRDSLNKK